MNMQPSEAEAGFNVRLPPTADPDFLRKRIAEEWAPDTRNMTYQVNLWNHNNILVFELVQCEILVLYDYNKLINVLKMFMQLYLFSVFVDDSGNVHI